MPDEIKPSTEEVNKNVQLAQEVVDEIDYAELEYGEPAKAVKKVLKPKVEKKEEPKPEAKKEIISEKKPIVVEEVDKKETPKEEAVKGKSKFYDPLAEETPKAESAKPEVKGVEKTPEQLEQEAKFPEYKTKAEKWEKFTNTTIGKFVIEAEEAGKNPIQALADIQYTDYSKFDYNKATDGEKEYFDRKVVTDYYASRGLQGDALETEVKEFMEADEDRLKRKDRADMVNHLQMHQDIKMNKYLDGLNQEKEQQKNFLPSFYKAVDKEIAKVREQGNLFGMQLADDKINQFSNECKNFLVNVFNKDGSLKMPFVQASTFFKLFGRDKLRQVGEDAESDGSIKVLEKVTKVDAENNTLQIKAAPKEFDHQEAIEKEFGGG